MSINPVEATTAIGDSYFSYLTTTFRFQDNSLQEQLKRILHNRNSFVNGPILEATAEFKKGASLSQLIAEKILSSEFNKLVSKEFPLHRPLYLHQEEALRKVIVNQRNIVVATGTGSGKTEAFLLPIINHLMQEKEQGQLGPGVRALLLYPMNALANDQMGRLRELLRNYPAITFGRYTGETEEKTRDARNEYRILSKSKLIENELISREQMRETPPHILLTNYAMLEYLLLRPDDNVFFDGKDAGHWRYIVIDEAHTFGGAKGIEMAMLLRRLKERVQKNSGNRIQCIATSATLGDGRKDAAEVTRFATQLFGEPFTWQEGDSRPQDVVYAEREQMVEKGMGWGKPDPELYIKWQKIINHSPSKDIVRELMLGGEKWGVPEQIMTRAHRHSDSNWPVFLFETLKGDQNLIRLQRELQETPYHLREMAKRIFQTNAQSLDALVALVDLANQARLGKDSQPLLPARYHVFVRAIEGAYLSLLPTRELYLERYEKIEKGGRVYKVFEAASCRGCGATYLAGSIQVDSEGKQILQQYTPESEELEYFLLLGQEEEIAELDEDDEVNFSGTVPELKHTEHYILCALCGAIGMEGALHTPCNCGLQYYFHLLRIPGKASTCPACGKRSPHGMVWRFLTGTDATASVLTTTLYQQLEPESGTPELVVNSEEQEDGWGPVSTTNTESTESQELRKLLVFSDSRQDAAFFAPYFDRTYNRILRRNLIIRSLQERREEARENQWRFQDLVRPVVQQAEQSGVFSRRQSVQEKQDEVWKWLFYELLSLDRRINLEGMGLLGFAVEKPDAWRAPPPLLRDPWQLTEGEVWTLFQVLMGYLRKQGVIAFPEQVLPDDEFFKPRNREFYFRSYSDSKSRKKGILGWNPQTINSRLDYLLRLAARINPNIDEKECRLVLDNIWNRSMQYPFWKPYIAEKYIEGEGTVYQLNHDIWQLCSSLIDNSLQWYICNRCQTLTLHNIRGTCPSYRCSGTLQPCEPETLFKDNHYFRLYHDIIPKKMVAQEHTAQLTSQVAGKLQNQFNKGEVNVLSCSTTFELGVDVGELETVFMRNVPPSAANYIQRAGRAGRRTSATAYVLTYAQRRSHDLDYYREPDNMVMGKIGVPHFTLENSKIISRHINAVALSAFWKKERELFGKVRNFFFGDDFGPDVFHEYLKQQPASLLDSIKNVVPQQLWGELGILEWGWVEPLFDNESGVLARAAAEAVNDIVELELLREESYQEGKGNVDYYTRLINTIKDKNLINYLASKNVLPKYGFPVDVVELSVMHHIDEARGLQLERDLRIALSEYAPGSQVVAAGKLWTSRFIKRLANKEWESYHYAICDHCQNYYRVRKDLVPEFSECPVCGQAFAQSGIFIIPAFGFVASPDRPDKPGENRPDKTYSTRVYFSGEGEGEAREIVKLGPTRLIATPVFHGKLAVINNAGGHGFKICRRCGFAVTWFEKSPRGHHTTPNRRKCDGKLITQLALGHEFQTDVLKLSFEGYQNSEEAFWLSLLYALLEGASLALDIERDDLDGCLYRVAGNPYSPQLIFYDDVPGGAGHVHRMSSREELMKILHTSLNRLEKCECGGWEGHTSCSGCLRNYRNQFCHDKLDRRLVIDFLRHILA